MSIDDLPQSLLANIFALLDAAELSRCTVVCKLWRSLATQECDWVWRAHYRQRWKVTYQPDDTCHGSSGSSSSSSSHWHTQYGVKMQQLRSWSGRYQVDQLHGHSKGVRCCKLLPQHNLLATGSLDRTVRLWDLAAGMPLAASKPHGGTVRCVGLDAGLLASGCADHLVRVWLPADRDSGASDGDNSDGRCGDAAVHGSGNQPAQRYRLNEAPDVTLRHTGPVSSLCLTERALYSGSWDYSVRVWDRHTWQALSVLTYDDWVGCVAVRGPSVMVAAGPVVYVHDAATGQVLRKFQDLHEGHITCLEGMQNGRLMFTGSTDGLVLSHDLRMRECTRVLWHHNACVQGLSYEDPWLATASADGTLVMLDTEGCMGYRSSTLRGSSSNSYGGMLLRTVTSPHVRQLHSGGGPAYCVDLSDQYLACGSESHTVRIWDFTKANEVAARAAAAKATRQSARAKPATKQPRGHQQQEHATGGTAASAAASRSAQAAAVSASGEVPVPMSVSPPNGGPSHLASMPFVGSAGGAARTSSLAGGLAAGSLKGRASRHKHRAEHHAPAAAASNVEVETGSRSISAEAATSSGGPSPPLIRPCLGPLTPGAACSSQPVAATAHGVQPVTDAGDGTSAGHAEPSSARSSSQRPGSSNSSQRASGQYDTSHQSHHQTRTRRAHSGRPRHTFNPFVPCPAPLPSPPARGASSGMRSLPLAGPSGSGSGGAHSSGGGFVYRSVPTRQRGSNTHRD